MSSGDPRPSDAPPRAWDAEDRIRIRLRELAEAAGIAAPRLELVEPKSWRPAAYPRRWTGTVAVSEPLTTASPAERDWHLAGALSWWASRRVQARHRLIYAVALLYCALGIFLIFGPVLDGFPNWARSLVVLVGAEVGHLARCWLDRSEQRAMDEAGAEILSAAQLDPAAVARAALAGEPTPAWWRRPFARVPAPQERIAAAESRVPRPAPPLH